MIWHHHEVTHAVAVAIKVQQRFSDDLRQLRPSQHTLAVTRIEKVFTAATELLLKIYVILWCDERKVLLPVRN